MKKEADQIEHHGDFSANLRMVVLTAMAAVVGVISALVAYGLVKLIYFFTNLSFYHHFSFSPATPENNPLGYLEIVVPVIGGLIVGLIARFGSEKIRGHGTPEALEAILVSKSKIEPKLAFLKPIASAVAIGTGGPFGAEGPIIMTGGAFGSLFAQFFRLTTAERKALLVAGAAAGMAAIFATPVAAVLLAVELLLFEWKPRSFIPVVCAASVAGALRVVFLGTSPIFPIPLHGTLSGKILLLSIIVGLAASLVARLVTFLYYAFEDLYEKLPVHWMWWPAIGGLFVGIGGLIEPKTLGVGYGVIHALLQGQVTFLNTAKIFFIKSLIWTISLSSGASGGVFAPLLMIGAAFGSLLSHGIPAGDTSLWTMIGMAAILGGALRVPLTSAIFLVELTHDMNALPALLISCVAAHAVSVLLMKRDIFTKKLAKRGQHIFREYALNTLEQIRVEEVMDRKFCALQAQMKVSELTENLAKHDPEISRCQAWAIVDENNRLAGIITHGDLLEAIEEEQNLQQTVLNAGATNVVVAYPDELLQDALERMVNRNISHLPVVSREDSKKLVGYLSREKIIQTWFSQFQEKPEPGWLDRFLHPLKGE